MDICCGHKVWSFPAAPPRPLPRPRPLRLILALLLVASGGAAAQSPSAGIGVDLLIREASLPPVGTLRTALRVTPAVARSYFSTQTGRTILPDQLGGTMTTASIGIEALYVASPSVALFASWIPGGTALSSFSGDQNRLAVGFSPVHLGVWLSLTGEHGHVYVGRSGRDTLNSGIALVVAIPIPWPDYEVQRDRLNEGVTYVAENSGVRAYGVGYLLKGHWRPAFSEFSVSVSHDLLFFFPARYDSAGLDEFEQNLIWEAIDSTEPFDTIRYRYQIGALLEPGYNTVTAAGARWRVGLPVGLRYRPPPMFDGNLAVRDTQEWHLDAGISASVVPAGLKRHWEFVADYTAPVAGKNVRAEHRFGLGAVVDLISRNRR